MNKQRNSSFELLRIICILIILLLHTNSHVDRGDMSLFNVRLSDFFSSIGEVAVVCFILISGYFKVTLKWEQFIRLIILTTVYSVILYFSLFGFSSINLIEFCKKLFVIPLYYNWFICCYLVLMLLSPFINQFCEICDKKNFTRLIVFLVIPFSVIPTMFNSSYHFILSDGGKCLTYFIFLYLTGRYIRLHRDVNVSRTKALFVFITSTLMINILNYILSAIFNKPAIYMLYSDCSIFIYISSISIFYLFKSFPFQSNWINYLSSSVLTVFLLDELRVFLDNQFIHLSDYATSYSFVVYWILLALFTFFVCIAIDKIRILLFTKTENYMIRVIIRISNYVYLKLKYSLKFLYE